MGIYSSGGGQKGWVGKESHKQGHGKDRWAVLERQMQAVLASAGFYHEGLLYFFGFCGIPCYGLNFVPPEGMLRL